MVRVPGATCWRATASRLSPSGAFHGATPASGLAADGLGWAGKLPLSGSLGPQTLLQAPWVGRGQVQYEEPWFPEVDGARQKLSRHGGCSPGPTARLSLCISGAGKIQGGPQGPEAALSTPFLPIFRCSGVLDPWGEVTPPPSRKLGLVSVPLQPQGLARMLGAPHPGDSAHQGLRGGGSPGTWEAGPPAPWTPTQTPSQPRSVCISPSLPWVLHSWTRPWSWGSVPAAVSQAPHPLTLAHLLCGPLEGCGGATCFC